MMSKAIAKDTNENFLEATIKDLEKSQNDVPPDIPDDGYHSADRAVYRPVELAEVYLQDDALLTFVPTSVGGFSDRSYPLRNVSSLPIEFEWKIHSSEQDIIQVEPENGTVLPDSTQHHIWRISPKEAKQYVLKPKLTTKVVTGEHEIAEKQHFTLKIVGEGTVAALEATQSYFDFTNVLVGATETKHVEIFNSGACDLNYRLSVRSDSEDSSDCDVQLSRYDGNIPARCRTLIKVTIRPLKCSSFQFSLFYQLIKEVGKPGEEQEPIFEEQHLCSLLATGVYPSLRITDIQGSSAAATISKKMLWTWLNVDSFNAVMNSPPVPCEMQYNMATRQTYNSHEEGEQPTKFRENGFSRTIVDLNFGAAPLNSAPFVVDILIENTGVVACDWCFKMPKDLQMELEYWAQSGEFTDDELEEMRVEDNALFSVKPKMGLVQPGENWRIRLKYDHKMVGLDRLPVLLRIANGREIMLNLVGNTTHLDTPYLHFASNKHIFAPVAVGEMNPPKQIFEMFNGGGTQLMFRIGTDPLLDLQKENYNHRILDCITQEGIVNPGEVFVTQWVFSPLEAKTYMVDLPVYASLVDEIDEEEIFTWITFTGVGFSSDDASSPFDVNTTGLPSVPSDREIFTPDQHASLSQDRLTFGNIPVFCRNSRVVFIQNKSDSKIAFEWFYIDGEDYEHLRVVPTLGVIPHRESVICKIDLITNGSPQFYDFHLICKIQDEDLVQGYKDELDSWTKEYERRKEEFCITEENPYADMISVDDDVPTPPHPDEGLPLRQYKTLPPIVKLTVDQKREQERAVRRHKKYWWDKPVMPEPHYLHLEVVARTHTLKDFEANFAGEVDRYFKDRSLSQLRPQSPTERVTQLPCDSEQETLLIDMLSHLLRSLTHDADFHKIVKKVDDAQVPYFTQFREKQRSIDATQLTAELLETAEPSEKATNTDVFSSVTQSRSSISDEIYTTSEIRGPVTTPPDTTRKYSMQQAQVGTHPELLTDFVPASRQEEFHQDAEVKLKKLPEVGNLIESVFNNALFNVVSEAAYKQFNPYLRQRIVALPPRPNTRGSLSDAEPLKQDETKHPPLFDDKGPVESTTSEQHRVSLSQVTVQSKTSGQNGQGSSGKRKLSSTRKSDQSRKLSNESKKKMSK